MIDPKHEELFEACWLAFGWFIISLVVIGFVALLGFAWEHDIKVFLG